MIRRWMTVLMSMTMVVALAGLTGCHKKVEKTEEVKTPAAAEQPQGQEEAQETQETQETETGPEPSPRPAGPVVYPNGEEPVLANGARIVRQERDPGHWEVEYTVNVPPQQMVDFYRQEAGRRGWTEQSSQSMGPGAFINWETPHGQLQVIVGKSAAGATSVDLNWNQHQ